MLVVRCRNVDRKVDMWSNPKPDEILIDDRCISFPRWSRVNGTKGERTNIAGTRQKRVKQKERIRREGWRLDYKRASLSYSVQPPSCNPHLTSEHSRPFTRIFESGAFPDFLHPSIFCQRLHLFFVQVDFRVGYGLIARSLMKRSCRRN